VQTDPAAALFPFALDVRLTGIPSPGSYFAHWTNDITGAENPRSYKVNQAGANLTAVFFPLLPDKFSLTNSGQRPGRVAADPAGNYFTNGVNITLTAIPNGASGLPQLERRRQWDGNQPCREDGQSRAITANFTRKPRLEVTRSLGHRAGTVCSSL